MKPPTASTISFRYWSDAMLYLLFSKYGNKNRKINNNDTDDTDFLQNCFWNYTHAAQQRIHTIQYTNTTLVLYKPKKSCLSTTMNINIWTYTHTLNIFFEYFLFGMQTQQCGTMPRHEANQAQPAVSALHTHFDVSHGMGLNAKCPGQQFERRYLYNYREHSCGPEYTVHLMVNFLSHETSCDIETPPEMLE